MDKETKILEKATKLFGEYGYKNTTIDLLASKCGMGKGTFYLYYNSKEEILNAIVRKEILKVNNIADGITKSKEPFNEQLLLFLKMMFELKNDQVFIAKLIQEAKEENNPIVVKYMKKLDDYILEELTKKITLAIEKKYIKKCNADFYAFLIYKTYMLLILEWENKAENKLTEYEIYDLLESLFKNN